MMVLWSLLGDSIWIEFLSAIDRKRFIFNHRSTGADVHLYIRDLGMLFSIPILSFCLMCWRATPLTRRHLLTNCISLLVCHRRSTSCPLNCCWLPVFYLWLTGVKSGLAGVTVTVAVKETESPIPLTWGNRTASCDQRCCRISGRTLSSLTMSCRSGTRYWGVLGHWNGTAVLSNWHHHHSHMPYLKSKPLQLRQNSVCFYSPRAVSYSGKSCQCCSIFAHERALTPDADVWDSDGSHLVSVNVATGGYKFHLIEKPPSKLLSLCYCTMETTESHYCLLRHVILYEKMVSMLSPF